MSQLPLNVCAEQLLDIHQSDRWRVYHRLHELSIACRCPADGRLWVEVNTAVEVFQVWSVLKQFRASRQELVSWLEDCWQAPSPD